MEFKAPTEGVTWLAKYNTTGGRRFSNLGLGSTRRTEHGNKVREPVSASSSLGTGLVLASSRHANTTNNGTPWKRVQQRVSSAPVISTGRRDPSSPKVPKRPSTSHRSPRNGLSKWASYHCTADERTRSKSRPRCGDQPFTTGAWERGDEKKEEEDDDEKEDEEGEDSDTLEKKDEATGSPCSTPRPPAQSAFSGNPPPLPSREKSAAHMAWEKHERVPHKSPSLTPGDVNTNLLPEPSGTVLDWSEKCREWIADISTSPQSNKASISRSAQSRDWSASSLTPLGQGICPELIFSNELWFKKGQKFLKHRRETENTLSLYGQHQLSDSYLHCPTASSRARQLHKTSSLRTEDWDQSRFRSVRLAYSVKPPVDNEKANVDVSRFKGTRTVTPEELQKIVERLSRCDPARVPDSGLSKGVVPLKIKTAVSTHGLKAVH